MADLKPILLVEDNPNDIELTLAALTVYWARRRWAGYVLLGVTANLVVGFVGLFVWGIL